MKRWLLTALAALILIGFSVWWFSPQQQLRRRSEALLRLFEIRDGRGAGILDMRAFGSMLGEQVQIDATAIGREDWQLSRDELQAAYRHLAGEARHSHFRIVRISGVDAADGQGVVRLRADCVIEIGEQRMIEGMHGMELSWRREAGTWKLQRIVWER